MSVTRVGHDGQGTRRRILAVAQELFAEQGYAGTSIADIAGRLGTSKAALYYHFRSKTEIIEALLARPLMAYSELADGAAAGRRGVEDVLGAVIDTTAELHALVDMISNDPSVRSALQHIVPRSRDVNEAITAALAGPHPDAAGSARAHAAYAAAKNGTLAFMSANPGPLPPAARSELLTAALRALA
jgi:AcrR family transcriptional regulator